ncbi:methylmalonyl Co-A mutase-associated GTPase MeaB [soil metagenome]
MKNDVPLDRRALGMTLTRLANADITAIAKDQLREPSRFPARRIGITGAPGAGKSSLLGRLAMLRLPAGRLAVLAVDPSSPRSGGAILGDRIRMDSLDGASELYIRSLASRHSSDGLADNLPAMLDAMDDFGFLEVMLETVGVGQAEYAARMQVDTLVLVLLPESGDIVQAMKAGIMEMADIFVVNKADLPGARQMVTDINRVAALARRSADAWVPPVLLTAQTQPDSIAELSRAIDAHQLWLQANHRREQLLEQRARFRLARLVEARVADLVMRLDRSIFELPLERQLEQVVTQLTHYEPRPTTRRPA